MVGNVPEEIDIVEPVDAVSDLDQRRLWIRRSLLALLILIAVGSVGGMAGAFWVFFHYGKDLPDFEALRDYQPPVATRVHAGDGTLLREYARERRLYVPISVIPQNMIEAIIAAEDKNFYTHAGVDMLGVLRAAVTNARNAFNGRRPVGGSTITQQVAKNFLVGSALSYERKIREAILAFRLEKAFTKDEILELYLNDTYLGSGSYGVAAASLNYFDKALDELSLSEAAYLAALHKGPSNYHPVRYYDRALGRRDWVLERMRIEGYLSPAQAEAARAEPLITVTNTGPDLFRADHFVEEIRRHIYDRFGGKILYEGGLSVRTTLEPRLQAAAETTLKAGLVVYDRRHGWRGPLTNLPISDNWAQAFGELEVQLGIDAWRAGLVLELREDGAVVGFEDESLGFVPFDETTWARAWRPEQKLGPRVKDISEVLALGDVVALERLADGSKDRVIDSFSDRDGNPVGVVRAYGLRQVPEIEGALVAVDPHTGRVLAMVGGYDYGRSEYNRATQAERQPGSAFKPIVYAAAFDSGFTPSTLVLDAPFVMEQGDGQGKWKPVNSSNKFYGPSTLRLGMEKSRNLMTVRLAQYIGMEKVAAYAERFGVGKNMQPTLAMALGAGEVTLLDLTAAYAILVNGGFRVKPTLIDRIQDRFGETVFQTDQRECSGCRVEAWQEQEEPRIPDSRQRVIDARTAYQVVSLMEGVVRNGTGRKIKVLGRPLAGKTGTTNDWVDGWFIGFSPDLVVGVFVGFDQPKTMGVNEEGSSVAVPIFRDFMALALAKEGRVPFRVPPGIRLVRVNAETGLPAAPGDKNIIFEAFLPGTEPTGERLVLDGSRGFMRTGKRVRNGTGGQY
jgi:penicillin-binding protein 1A